MNPWAPSPYAVTPVAVMLARCVARGLLSQEDVDSVPKETYAFSSHLQETEQQMKSKRRLNEVLLEIDLLKLEKENADVTHQFYLSRRFVALQKFTSHLQEVLREQTILRQRLMKPLCQTNLPIHADLHRYVVDLIKMVVDFIETLEKHMTTVRTIPTVSDAMVKLNNALTQLLAQVTEVEKLSEQVIQWRDRHISLLTPSKRQEE
ncbi:HAUS augmin-like complex subunit 2 [Lampris incognitus]|uniref:HAUS augmin-like complex subunit 2 n=1 Tax=Lampris incognitus TaxID=2546036 RepID=UPI0024B5D078|nr:HAUS augmin-like complex subunit 2 [Lampris incognitus]XP_056152230.1 HAUS augmin-like complex subunit 2 [Lampris incognitus]